MSHSLFSFLGQAVSPWHASEALARRLSEAGFRELAESERWILEVGKGYFLRRGGSTLAAFIVGSDTVSGWNVVAAHTDSPGWRLKLATQKRHESEVIRIGTEVYGSPIHGTWFDRPLAVAGQVFANGPGGPEAILVNTEALGVIPNLAIHYNREINKGQPYDLSEHLCLLAALGPEPDLQTFVSKKYGFDVRDWIAADLFVVDPSPPVAPGT